MKKLLFILSAILVSVTGWAGLNPYAYGLKSYLNDDKSELTMIYTLNADAETSLNNNTSIGVQVHIYEKESGNIVKTLTNGRITQGTCTLTVATADLPKEVPLSWKVVVHGNAKQTQPAVVHDRVSNNRPNATHGVAIDKNPESQNFGNIYYTEASSGNLNTTWDWMEKYTRPCVWQYSPQLTYLGHFYKDKENNVDVSNFVTSSQVEPHRIRISDDNRIFVSSCYADATTVVWEYKGGNNFNKVITRTNSYGRVLGMDVFGSGNNLKILLCYMSGSKLTFREYALGSAGSISGSGTDKGTYTDATLVTSSSRVGVAYDDNGDSFWFAIDRSTGYSSRVIHMKKSGSSYVCGTVNKCPLNTGGDGLFVKGDLLVKGIATSGDNTAAGRLYFFKINGDKIMNDAGTASLKYYNNCEFIDVWSSYWVNGMDMDYAGNLYIASAYAGNAIAISMPYDGKRETKARDVYTFTVSDPVPNILATDLRCEPHATQNKYIFSFNTNTKPEEAQIRFYYSYEDMQKSLNVVNADNYNGTNANKPAFVYNIPDDKLKQGRIEVELGGVCGKLDANNVIINDSLPAGVLYWSVYVKTRESKAFAPIYEQSTTGEDVHNRLHATVNNYPETDGFGHIYAVNYYSDNDTKNGLMEYNFNPSGNSNDEQNNIKNSNRYKLVKNHLNSTGSKPKFQNQRRLTVAPDGKVYIADCGSSQPFDKNSVRPWLFNNGGVYVWDPSRQSEGEIQITQFLLDKTESSTAVAIYNHGGELKMYATNTYGEFSNHSIDKHYWQDMEYTEDNQADVKVYGWNGFKEYNLGTPENILQQETNGTILRSLGMGDGNGNISLVATEKGVWLAQHRLNDVQYTIDQFNSTKKVQALPDNNENYILSFVPYGTNERSWTSCSGKGIEYKYTGSGSNKVYTGYEFKDASELTQLTSSPLQACPGAGLAYRKTTTGAEYLYIVNHQGNIVELQITEWVDNKPTVKYIKTYPGSGPKGTNDGGRTDGAISSMCFDYAGNLVTTSGADYLGSASQNILVYTMPYDRVNAREIQAPNSCRMIPERIAHLDMTKENMDAVIGANVVKHPQGCAIDLYRPLQGGMFNTICLPCTLDLKTLPEGHPLYKAELKQYTGLNLNTVGGEKVLELVFTDVSDRVIIANKPYIIQPEENYNSIIRFAGPLRLTNTTGEAVNHEENSKNYNITYQGIIPYQKITPIIQDGVSLTLMLVADNRLAEMTTEGYMYGFRGYFELNQPLPKGMRTRITTSKGTTTNTTIVVDGKKVNVEKFLQEGRVYIRMGDSLYTITGEKVE